jgi:hypothetical protein
MTSHRRGTDPVADKARAEALFRKKEQQRRESQSATGDYVAKQDAERAKNGQLRELRLAAEAKAGGERKAERKPGWTTK